MFFSIVITTYNAEKFLIDALNSLKNQTFQDFECIITDDFSTDKTLDVCKQWLSENPKFQARTQIIEHPENTGVSANTNRGLKAASCEWIQVLSADDMFPKDSLEKAHTFILEHPECSIFQGVAAVYRNHFNEQNFLRYRVENFKKTNFLALSAEKQYQQLLYCCSVVSPAVFYKKTIVEEVGFCDETIPLIDDWPLWLKITKAGYKFYFLNEVLINYRLHEHSLSNENQGVFVSDLHRKNRPVFKRYIFPNISPFKVVSHNFTYVFKEVLFRFFNSEKNRFSKAVLLVLRFFKRKVFKINTAF